jgi:hypothetical protein
MQGGGLTVEEGSMMTTTESANIPFGGVGKGDGMHQASWPISSRHARLKERAESRLQVL